MSIRNRVRRPISRLSARRMQRAAVRVGNTRSWQQWTRPAARDSRPRLPLRPGHPARVRSPEQTRGRERPGRAAGTGQHAPPVRGLCLWVGRGLSCIAALTPSGFAARPARDSRPAAGVTFNASSTVQPAGDGSRAGREPRAQWSARCGRARRDGYLPGMFHSQRRYLGARRECARGRMESSAFNESPTLVEAAAFAPESLPINL